MDEARPLVSVIIPTYKRSETLARAINSVMAQTYEFIELIVVDDNADFPEVRSANKELILKYPQIKFICNDKNLGGGLSRNEGLKVASGEFVAFLDDDDEYLPTKIEKQIDKYFSLNNQDIAIIYCYAEMVNIDKTTYTYYMDYEGTPLLENIKHCLAPTSFWLCKKEKLMSVGGFENISSRQDASLITKLILNNFRVHRVPEVLLKYYWHNSSNGISKRNIKMAMAEIQYRDMFNNIAQSKKIDKAKIDKANFLFAYRIAREYIAIGMRKEAFLQFKEMCKYKVFSIMNMRVLFTIVFNKSYLLLSNLKNRKRIGH